MVLITGTGEDELKAAQAAASGGPSWDANENAWFDGGASGLYSYDDGASWEPKRYNIPPPVSTAGALASLAQSTGNYSLNTPALENFNIQTLTPEEPLSDGLGHWWDSSVQAWRNDDGSLYNALQSAPPPVSTDAALALLDGPTQPGRAGFLDYDLGIEQNPPVLRDPWSAAAVPQDKGDGFWDGFTNAAKDIAEPFTLPYHLANTLADRYTGSTESERWNSNISGNQFADLVSGGQVDLSQLPYGLDAATDAALAPATWLTAGMGQSVPILGSTFGGAFGQRLAGEAAVGAAAILGSEAATSDVAESIPLFGDQPDWLQALEGGFIGVGGALGAVGAAKQAPDILRAAHAGEEGAMRLGKAATPLDAAKAKILQAAREEATIRRVGTAEREIAQGRKIQVSGIMDALADESLSPLQRAEAAREGARIGQLRETVATVALTPDEKAAVIADVVGRVNAGEAQAFDIFRVIGEDSALEKLIAGRGLQPKEIEWVRRTFGDEVAEAVSKRRITAPDAAAMEAKELAETRRLNAKAVAQQEAQIAREVQRAGQREFAGALGRDTKALKAKWATIAKAADLDSLKAIMASPGVTQEERDIALSAFGKQAKHAQELAANAMDRAIKANPNTAQLQEQARALIPKVSSDPAVQSALNKTVDAWLASNRAIIDGLPEGANLRSVMSGLATGNIKDSFVAGLISQRDNLTKALTMQGTPTDAAKQIADQLVYMELKYRYPGGIPKETMEAFQSASRGLPAELAGGAKTGSKTAATDGAARAARNAITGLGDFVQEWKNLQFGLGDFAVLGVQALKAATTGSVNLTAGLTNRILGAFNVGMLDETAQGAGLAKKVQYTIDGVMPGARTGMTDFDRSGTVLSHIPYIGKQIDRPVVRAGDWLTELQFGTILGSIRDLNHEGNLVMLKLTGNDIADPAVRARAAAWANWNTSAAHLAQDSTRQAVERATLLTPSMRRAQAAQIANVASAFSPVNLAKAMKAGGTQRANAVMAISTIASFGASTLAASKLLHDYLGKPGVPFQWDPSKPGFGNVTLKDGTVINPFPQEQVLKAVARSMRLLEEGHVTDSDWESIGRQWGNLLMASASPALRIGMAAGGLGYDPNQTSWRYGDWMEGKGVGAKMLELAPIPPIGQEVIRDGVTPGLGLSAIGLTNYEESKQTLRDQYTMDKYGMRYSDLSSSQKKEVDTEYGKVYSSDATIAAKQKEAADVTADLTSKQQASDARRESGELTPEQWRNDYTARKEERFYKNDQIWAGTDFKPGNDKVLNAYYDAIDGAERTDGTVDWDKVDAYVAGLSEGDRAWVAANTGLVKLSTPATEAFDKEYRTIKDSGWFKREDAVWKPIARDLGLPYEHYDDWYKAQREALFRDLGATTEDQKLTYSAEVDKFINKDQVAKYMANEGSAWREEFAITNPEAAYLAWKYGYWNPPAAVREALRDWQGARK